LEEKPDVPSFSRYFPLFRLFSMCNPFALDLPQQDNLPRFSAATRLLCMLPTIAWQMHRKTEKGQQVMRADETRHGSDSTMHARS
jgi:hypothetical protein